MAVSDRNITFIFHQLRKLIRNRSVAGNAVADRLAVIMLAP